MTVYLDHAATTPVSPAAVQAAVNAMTEGYGNPSSTHALGRSAKKLMDTARAQVAKTLGAKPGEIFFTAGGTEADNWAITAGMQHGKRLGKHFVTTAIEHDAVLETARHLEQTGFRVTYVAPEADGSVSAKAVLDAVEADTAMVSVMLVNNETGAVNPVADIARGLKAKVSRALLHTDAVQAYLKRPFTVQQLGVDLLTVSGHKIFAPKGVGALYIRSGLHLTPLIYGGGQEQNLRSGTENVPAIAAFGAAAEEGFAARAEHIPYVAELGAHLRELLQQNVPQAQLLCPESVPDILSISLPGYRSEVLVNALDAAGIAISRSSACKRGGRSHVLAAMNLPAAVIDGALRISISHRNTKEEIEYFVRSLGEAAASLRHR